MGIIFDNSHLFLIKTSNTNNKTYFMKRTLLLTAIAIFSFSSSFAQTEVYGRSVRFGFKVDPVFVNNLSPKENGIEKAGSGFGINYGLMADILFSDGRGAFATGVEVAHSSAKLNYVDKEGIHGKGEYKLKLQHLQIPLSVKLKTNDNNGLRWWGQFGTYVAPLLSSRLDFDPSGSGSSVSNEKAMSSTNRLNMGLLIGAGGEYNISEKTDLFFGLGFENGFTDVTTNGKWNDDGKVNLNRWALRLGMFF